MKVSILIFIVFQLLFLLPSLTIGAIPSPQYASNPDQRARAVSSVEADIRSKLSDPDFQHGAKPLYQFHPAGKKTHGTVVFWHGGGTTPSDSSLLAR